MKLEKEFSQDPTLLRVLLFEPRLCTLNELQTVYSLEDLYDLLELVEVRYAVQEEENRILKEQQAKGR